jgi:hypothetical protein
MRTNDATVPDFNAGITPAQIRLTLADYRLFASAAQLEAESQVDRIWAEIDEDRRQYARSLEPWRNR